MAEGDVTKGSPIPPIELQPRHIAILKASRPHVLVLYKE